MNEERTASNTDEVIISILVNVIHEQCCSLCVYN